MEEVKKEEELNKSISSFESDDWSEEECCCEDCEDGECDCGCEEDKEGGCGSAKGCAGCSGCGGE